jgi:hypothetical protein
MFCTLQGQTYCIKRSHFVTDYLELKVDSFSFFKSTDCNATEYSFNGVLNHVEDTIILNPYVFIDSLKLTRIKKVIGKPDQCLIRIMDSSGKNLDLFESWTDDSLNYCCIFDSGVAIMKAKPDYNQIWVNPLFFRNYILGLPLVHDFELGHKITYEIQGPKKYYMEFETETIFIKKKEKN